MKQILLVGLVLFFTLSNCLAQDDAYNSINKREKTKNQKIKSGYVFIDGKYFEQPYKVKRKGLSVFINREKIFSIEKPHNPLKLKSKPEMPLETLNQNSSLNAISAIKNKEYNLSYIRLIRLFYLENYDFDSACDSIKAFYSTLPNVKSIEPHKKSNYTFEIHAYNGEIVIFSLKNGRTFNKKYGPARKNTFSRRNLIRSTEAMISYISEELLDNSLLFLFTDETSLKSYYKYPITQNGIYNVYNILESNYSDSIKIDNLNKTINNKYVSSEIFKSYNAKGQIYELLNNIITSDSTYNQIKNSNK